MTLLNRLCNRRHAIARACFVILVLLAGSAIRPAWAINEIATNNAFDALLSMPQTQPEEGTWDHVAPDGFAGQDEQELIRWLAKQKKLGADLNQTRHQGTLLHHAIRGGLNHVAGWLIANGADPLKTLEGGDVPTDALALSIQYRRWALVDALLKLPAVTAPERESQLLVAWRAAQGADGEAVVARLLALRMPLLKGAAGEQLLSTALNQHWMKLVLVLTEAGVNRVPASDGIGPVAGKGGLPGADIELADARLVSPIFPYLLSYIATPGDVDTLWKLRIRHPFGELDFTRQVLLQIIAAPASASVKHAMLERLPRDALKAAFDGEEIFGPWLRWSTQLPAADGDWALAALGDLPARRPSALLDAMIKGAYWYEGNEHSPNLASGWGRLLARMRSPLPVDIQGKLWMFVPPEYRPALLRLGYRPSDKELADWLERNNLEAIRLLWPQIKAAIPELTARIHEILFAYNNQTEYACYRGAIPAETLAKAQLLLDTGAKPRKPLLLYPECQKEFKPALLLSLETAGLFKRASAMPPKYLVRDTTSCNFRPNDLWRHALIDHASVGDLAIEGAQPIDMPGETQCALLVWGGSAGGRTAFDDDSFTGTIHLSPCTDGPYATAIWRVVDGKLKQSLLGNDNPAVEVVLPLRDTRNNQHLLLAGGIGQGGCGQTPNFLLVWNQVRNAEASLQALPDSHPAMQALWQQCEPGNAWACFGAEESNGVAENPLANFIDVQWAADRKAYLDAVLALNYDALRASQKAGIFPDWTLQAIDAVSKANLSVEDKRRRTAWLFRDATQLKRALAGVSSYNALNDLVVWLPREDWQPVIKAIQGENSRLELLLIEANRQGKKALACRFATVLHRVCAAVER